VPDAEFENHKILKPQNPYLKNLLTIYKTLHSVKSLRVIC